MTDGMPSFPTPVAPTPRRALPFVVAAVMLTAVLAIGGWYVFAAPTPTTAPTAASNVTDTLARVPPGIRVRVRVINTTPVAGLARRATLVLREFGYDVVEFETGKGTRIGTVIEIHTAHPEWATRLQRAMGVGAIESRPDTSRMVDLSVFVGTDWRPPTQPLRP